MRLPLVVFHLCAFAMFAGHVLAAAPVADPLDRPALISKHATSAVLLDITRAGDRLLAVGERGTVLLSDDNGQTWRQARTVPVAVSLTRVRFVTSRHGWIVGHAGVVLATDDGGETWIRRLDGRAAAQQALADARSSQGKTDARLVATAEQLVADGPDKPFLDLHFFDEKRGFVIGAYGIIFRTDDGGKSWRYRAAHVDNPKGLHLNAIAAVGDDLYIAGERGLVLRSTDRGDSFEALKLPYSGSFFAVAASEGKVLIGGLRGHAFASGDRGRTWSATVVPVPVTLIGATNHAMELLFVNQAGQLLRGDASALRVAPLPPLPPLTAVVGAADGALVAASLRGPARLPPGP